MSRKYEGDRAVSFLDVEAARWLKEEAPVNGALEDGLCLGRFHADHVVPGVTGWKIGQLVEIGGRMYEVTITGKRCFPECGLLQREGTKCPLAAGAAFGRPLEEKAE